MKSYLLGSVFAGMVTVVEIVGAASVTSTFDTDLDGWTSDNTPAEIGWAATGGNPGGYVRFDPDTTGNATAILAPSTFLGDWTSFDMVGKISYDHKIFSLGGGFIFLPYRIDIKGPGGTAFWEGETPSGLTDWPLPPDQTVVAPLREDVWSITNGSWSGLLSNITELRIQIELVDNTSSGGGDIAGIDNVNLSSIPIPSAVWLFGSGLLGLIGMARRKKS
jgi:hypothetical protein